MKNYVYALMVSASLLAINLNATDGIRLYQENDHSVLKNMLANNDELLIPADAEHQTHESRLAFTERYLSSNNYITKVYSKITSLLVLLPTLQKVYAAQ